MLELWRTSGPWGRFFFVYFSLGLLGVIISFVAAVVTYYKEYEQYLQGKMNSQPTFMSTDLWDATMFSLFMIFLWPVAIVFILWDTYDWPSVGQIVNRYGPLSWLRWIAVRRNKAMVVTHPNQEVRKLINVDKQAK